MPRILLAGHGKMGSALLQGWLASGTPPDHIVVVDPASTVVGSGVRCAADPAAIPADFTPDVVILAVKPQAMAEVLPHYRRFAGSSVFLSIAAGKSIAFFQSVLGPQAAIVRAMPNTPAALGRGVTVCCASPQAAAAQVRTCADLLSAVGTVEIITDESLMDAVTAVSGSGPAYVFRLAEALTDAGIAAGLPADLAERLALRTVAGAGAMLDHQAGTKAEAAALRTNVTSPGGTTAAALEVLMDPQQGLSPLMERAVQAATQRSRALNT